MTQRKVHNPNGVDTAAALRYREYLPLISAIQEATRERHRIDALRYAFGALRGVACLDCDMWLGFVAPDDKLCGDCRCIRETGEQCVYPDMETVRTGNML